MGHYTDICLGVRLSSTTPDEVVNILEWMCRDQDPLEPDWPKPPYPDHPFFEYWSDTSDINTWGHPCNLLLPHPYCVNTNGMTSPSFERDYYNFENPEAERHGHRLSVYTSTKGNWDNFLEFIKPYCCTPDPPSFVGYLLSDHNSVPTLLFCNGRGGIDRMVPPQ